MRKVLKKTAGIQISRSWQNEPAPVPIVATSSRPHTTRTPRTSISSRVSRALSSSTGSVGTSYSGVRISGTYVAPDAASGYSLSSLASQILASESGNEDGVVVPIVSGGYGSVVIAGDSSNNDAAATAAAAGSVQTASSSAGAAASSTSSSPYMAGTYTGSETGGSGQGTVADSGSSAPQGTRPQLVDLKNYAFLRIKNEVPTQLSGAELSRVISIVAARSTALIQVLATAVSGEPIATVAMNRYGQKFVNIMGVDALINKYSIYIRDNIASLPFKHDQSLMIREIFLATWSRWKTWYVDNKLIVSPIDALYSSDKIKYCMYPTNVTERGSFNNVEFDFYDQGFPIGEIPERLYSVMDRDWLPGAAVLKINSFSPAL